MNLVDNKNVEHWMVKRTIRIRDADGDLRGLIQVSGKDTIGKLKNSLLLDKRDWVLSMGGEVLDDDKTCRELRLEDGDVLLVSAASELKQEPKEQKLKDRSVQRAAKETDGTDEKATDSVPEDGDMKDESSNDALATVNRIAPGAKTPSRSNVPTYKTAYVKANSDTRNFYHRGKGYWAEGLPPAGSEPTVAVRGPGADEWKKQASADYQDHGSRRKSKTAGEDE